MTKAVKIQSFLKFFGNFVPNFREWIANSKTHNQKPNKKAITLMNTVIQTSTNRPRKDLLVKPFQSSASALILLALVLSCAAVSPAALLKEHKKVEIQQATIGQLKSDAAKQEVMITELKKEMQTVVARIKEEDSKIQKVSAQVGISKPTPRVVTNP